MQLQRQLQTDRTEVAIDVKGVDLGFLRDWETHGGLLEGTTDSCIQLGIQEVVVRV